MRGWRYRVKSDSKVFQVGSGYEIGIGYKTFSDSMKIGFTFTQDYGDEEMNVNFGSEFNLSEYMDIRLGIYEGSFSGGFGFDFNFLTLDYAYYNEEFLDMNNSSHLMSTTFHF